MPPKKRARKSATARAAVDPLEELKQGLARLSRTALEALIIESLTSTGSLNLSVEAVLAKLPTKEVVIVPEITLRGGGDSGYFQGLSTQIHVNIFKCLQTRERLQMVSEICMGWRDLKQESTLWQELKISCVQSSWNRESAWINGVGLRRLVAVLPLKHVRSLDIGGDNCTANDIKHVFSKHEFPSLAGLVLSGKRIGSSVVQTVVKQDFMSKLTSLNVSQAKVKPEEIFTLVRKAPLLAHIFVKEGVTADFLSRLASVQARQRGGGSSGLTGAKSILETIHENWGWGGGVTVDELLALPTDFPELKQLRLGKVHCPLPLHQQGFGEKGDGLVFLPAPAPALAFSRLRDLHLRDIGIRGYNNFSSCLHHGETESEERSKSKSVAIDSFLSRLLASTPNLEAATLAGYTSYVSGSDRKAGKRPFPLVALTRCLAHCALPRLTALTLTGFDVRAAAFDGLAAGSLESLSVTSVDAAGAAAAATSSSSSSSKSAAAKQPLEAALTRMFPKAKVTVTYKHPN